MFENFLKKSRTIEKQCCSIGKSTARLKDIYFLECSRYVIVILECFRKLTIFLLIRSKVSECRI